MVCTIQNKSTYWFLYRGYLLINVFVFAAGENYVVGLINPTIYSEDTPAAYMPGEDIVHTIIHDMTEEI